MYSVRLVVCDFRMSTDTMKKECVIKVLYYWSRIHVDMSSDIISLSVEYESSKSRVYWLKGRLCQDQILLWTAQHQIGGMLSASLVRQESIQKTTPELFWDKQLWCSQYDAMGCNSEGDKMRRLHVRLEISVGTSNKIDQRIATKKW